MIPVRLPFAHLRRNKLRSLLTVASVTVTLFLFCTLRTVITTLEGLVSGASSNRLVTSSAVSLFVLLPVSMWQKLLAVPGVEDVTHWTWFGGTYGDAPKSFFARFGVDVPSMRRIYGDKAAPGRRDLLLPAETWDAFERDRRACVVGPGLAERFGWKVGSRFTLTGSIFPGEYEFTIAGIYEAGGTNIDKATMFFHWDYLNETAGQPNRVGTYSLLLDDPDRAGEVTAAVDALFESSSNRTRTFSERAFNAQFVQMWGNVPLLLTGIGIAVFFACIMITVNTMLLLARERVRETGILKAIGFADFAVAGVSLFEAMLLCLLGAAIGTALSMGLYRTEGLPIESFLPGFRVQDSTIREALGLGVLLGLLSGLAPALFVKRLSALQALRRVG